ncbi:hypothetical protein GGI43DRAFT_132981 [Trichoderma evansii]
MPCYAMHQQAQKQRTGDVIRDGLSGEPGNGRQRIGSQPSSFLHKALRGIGPCTSCQTASSCAITAGSTTFGLESQQTTKTVNKKSIPCRVERLVLPIFQNAPIPPNPCSAAASARANCKSPSYLAAMYSIPLAGLVRLGPHRWPRPRLHLVHALSRSRCLDLHQELGVTCGDCTSPLGWRTRVFWQLMWLRLHGNKIRFVLGRSRRSIHSMGLSC